MLQAVGQYCFLPSTLEKVENICKAAVGVLSDIASPTGESVVVPVEGTVREGVDPEVVVTAKVCPASSATSISKVARLHIILEECWECCVNYLWQKDILDD